MNSRSLLLVVAVALSLTACGGGDTVSLPDIGTGNQVTTFVINTAGKYDVSAAQVTNNELTDCSFDATFTTGVSASFELMGSGTNQEPGALPIYTRARDAKTENLPALTWTISSTANCDFSVSITPFGSA